MKNMKKILAVGALLTLGTMALGTTGSSTDGQSANENFTITLGVVKPISIVKGNDIDFGYLTTNQITAGGESAIGEFTVNGQPGDVINFTVAPTGTLQNGNDTISYTSEIHERGATAPLDSTVNTNLDGDGNFLGDLKLTLGAEANPNTTSLYSGIINVLVSYN